LQESAGPARRRKQTAPSPEGRFAPVCGAAPSTGSNTAINLVTTTGNATLIVCDGKPLLAADPWFGDEDPAYFGSWVLSHRIPRLATLIKTSYS